MKYRDSAKSQTPLSPPLSGGKHDKFAGKYSSEKNALTPPPLFEAGSQRSCGVPASIPLAGARGGREELAFVPYNKNLTAFARENRKHPTAAESKLRYQLLRTKNLSAYKFTRQKPIANFIANFYCAELHLVIEIDGDSHAESLVYDTERTKALSSLGTTVVRYTNDDILNNLQGVYVDLARSIAILEGTA